MTISRDRFELALQRLNYPDWDKFERLASTFLASEFDNVRSMAAPSGDGGRDSELFNQEGELNVAFQFSVTGEWGAKIRATMKRLEENFSEVRELIYLTNQTIGAKGDAVKREMSKKGVSLDIRDITWFLDRANLDTNRSAAAEQLAIAMVDPLLSAKGLAPKPKSVFSPSEAQTALFYLEMQREDEESGKNLTRSCFDALVKAALAGTNRDNRASRQEIYERVVRFLPRYEVHQLKPFIDSALLRLKKNAISEWANGSEYHLSHDEAVSIKDRAARLLLMQSALEADVRDIVAASESIVISDLTRFTECVQAVIEKYFVSRGDEFVKSLSSDIDIVLHDDDLRSAISSTAPSGLVGGRNQSEFIRTACISLMNNPSDATRNYLRILSDSYTLFAFLSETPDVQKATNKLFRQGELWLDTSVLLPVIAETTAPTDDRPFTGMFEQLSKASAKMYVTPGVIEEVRHHLEICVMKSRSEQWFGGVPFVYTKYILNGGQSGKFASWIERFMGSYDPLRDLEDYFERMNIYVENPGPEDLVSPDLVRSIYSYWQEVHGNRRRDKGAMNHTSDLLARHDAENCITVIGERKKNRQRSGLGHSCWWLTLDTAAYKLKDKLDRDIWKEIGFSPVISLDYMMKYLAFGPARDRITSSEASTSRIFTTSLRDAIPPELLAAAEKVRELNGGMPENLIQRKIRDTLDRERERIGEIHQNGGEELDISVLI
ncbi:hypothetical protein [Brevundimonas sp. G8]|uniref:hypothetical protein n=1 Tax=Brevundimonas sp. G8 TaxID=1350776 RepID=UPI0012F23E81|nr:hypothetical protein [Brevundimonas sp. G8]VXC07750.1 conserved hypothetical protein [Brevundimonas sp. G8]